MKFSLSHIPFVKAHPWISLCLSIYLFVAIFGPILSNDKALICSSEDGLSFPAFNNQIKKDECNWSIGSLIPYSYQSIDPQNRKKGPFDQQEVEGLLHRHWLGTDTIGRDVLAGLIRGARISFFVASVSLLIAFLIGMLVGYLMGLVGDDQFSLNLYQILFALLGMFFAVFYLINSAWILAVTVLFLCLSVIFLLSRINNTKCYTIPLDWILMRKIELFKSIPGLFLLLFFLTLFKQPSYWNIILIIALTAWTGIARFARAELLKIKASNFYLSSKSFGQSSWSFFWSNAIKNILPPITIALAYGFSSTVLLEASLSFLGIGIPADEVSWGGLLSEARKNFSMWWMAIFPGIAIYLVLVSFNQLAKTINQSERLG